MVKYFNIFIYQIPQQMKVKSISFVNLIGQNSFIFYFLYVLPWVYISTWNSMKLEDVNFNFIILGWCPLLGWKLTYQKLKFEYTLKRT